VLRLIHTADWQIGKRFNRIDEEDAAALYEARFAAVDRIARLAREKSADAVLVAGDVFDAQTVSNRSIQRVFNSIKEYAGPWVIVPGNHDALLSENVWRRAKRLKAMPDNVHFFDEPGQKEFKELGFVVLGAPLTQKQTSEDLTEWFDTEETAPELLRIGLAHGSVLENLPEGFNAANPIAADRAKTARLDYLALGDWHGTMKIDERTWYSGTPEQDRFRGNDPGHILLVEIERQGRTIDVEPCRVGKHRWYRKSRELVVGSDIDILYEEISALEPESVIDLSIEGALSLADYERLQRVLTRIEAAHRSVHTEKSGLRLKPTEEDISGLHVDGYLVNVIDTLKALQVEGTEAESAKARDALSLLVEFLSQRSGED